MRFLTLLALLFAAPAHAATGFAATPCPRSTIGQSWSYPPPITGVSYDSQDQLLYVIWNYRTAQAFSNVPVSIIYLFSNGNNPVTAYNNAIVPQYHQILLSQKDNCPISWEQGGYIWTD